jgi:hypothetical protein
MNKIGNIIILLIDFENYEVDSNLSFLPIGVVPRLKTASKISLSISAFSENYAFDFNLSL